MLKLCEFFQRRKPSTRVSTKEEIQEFNRPKWIEYKFLPSPGLEYNSSNGLNSIPLVRDWRFSPRGRTGVSIVERIDSVPFVLLLDVHNKLWYGNSIKIPELKFQLIYTYHMLNETTLIVVELSESNVVKQHIINVNLETRVAEFEETKVHEFVRREEVRQPFNELSAQMPHVSISVKEENYTVVVVHRNPDIQPELALLLVPLNPLNTKIKPKEFFYFVTLSPEIFRRLSLLTESDEQHNLVQFTVFSSGGLLYSPIFVFPGPPPHERQHILCVYSALDVSKLIDVHEKPVDIHEQMDMYEYQVNAWDLVSHNMVEFIGDRNDLDFSSVFNGSMVIFNQWPSNQSRKTHYTNCQILESMRTLKIKTPRYSWLILHPCGAVLQFKQSPENRRLFVRVVSHWNNSLESITSSKLILHPNRPIDSIKGLHRMIFGLKPISLDETAKKAIGICQIENFIDFEIIRLMDFLAFGIPLTIFAIIQFTFLFMI